MAYDRALADRIRRVVARQRGIGEKEMFGGICFLLRDKMFCGVAGKRLMVRVGPERYEEALAKPHVRIMDFTGRPMKGYVFVGAKGCATTRSVRPWVKLGTTFVATLPANKKKRKRKARG